MDVVEIILSVDDRLEKVENKYENGSSPGKEGTTDDESKKDAELDEEPERDTNGEERKPLESQPCVPQIRMFDWYNFKNKWVDDKRYAIEVLKGPAKYYQDRTKEQRQYEKSKKTGHTPVRSQPDAEQGPIPPQDIPERIRIVSSPLIAIITELDPINFSLDLTPGVMLRPYKRLARMESDLMKHLSGLEAKWGDAEKEDLERKAKIGSDVTEDEQSTRKPPENDNGKVIPKPTLEFLPASKESSPAVTTELRDRHLTPSDPLTDSIEALRDLRCLKQFYEIFIHPTVNRLRYRTARKIRFADLWYLFPHGEEVFVPAAHKTEVGSISARSVESSFAYQSVYRVWDHAGGRAPLSMPPDDEPDEPDPPPSSASTSRLDSFWLACYHIDWSTKSYWPIAMRKEIKAFDNERDITSLETYPTVYHENFGPIREYLTERGQRFVQLTKPTHMNCYGRTYTQHPTGQFESDKFSLSKTQFVDSEVMVDFEQTPTDWRPKLGLLDCLDYPRETIEDWNSTVWKDKEHSQVDNTFAESTFGDHDDEKWLRDKVKEQDSFLHSWDSYQGGREPVRLLDKSNDLILLPSRVMGYSYRDRTFNAFDIDCLEPVTQKSEGFDGLELPKGHQQMVEALVKEHFIKKEIHEKQGRSAPGMDIVSGKGKGLIILLHGAPGVGKTSTAECVAQSTGRPLFPITSGDLGLSPEQVEESLTAKFRLAAKWNCVMLIDEADIFLARREYRDLQRNALVSGKSSVWTHGRQ